MVRTLFDCVGDWFEDVVQAQFSDLKAINNEKGTRPDFRGSSFDAEAKTGYWDYGAQLKEAQIEGFKPREKPLVYIIGYHNLIGLRKDCKSLSEKEIDTLLKTRAGLHSVYIVSNQLIKKIWNKENHTATKHPEWNYFSVRPRHLDAIIYNSPFERKGICYTPSRWYRICRPEFILKPAPLLKGRTDNLEYGVLLHKKTDKPAIDYLIERRLI